MLAFCQPKPVPDGVLVPKSSYIRHHSELHEDRNARNVTVLELAHRLNAATSSELESQGFHNKPGPGEKNRLSFLTPLAYGSTILGWARTPRTDALDGSKTTKRYASKPTTSPTPWYGSSSPGTRHSANKSDTEITKYRQMDIENGTTCVLTTGTGESSTNEIKAGPNALIRHLLDT